MQPVFDLRVTEDIYFIHFRWESHSTQGMGGLIRGRCLTLKIFGIAFILMHIPETVMQVEQWAWLG